MTNVTKPVDNPLQKAKSRATLSFIIAMISCISMVLLAIVCWYLWTQMYVNKTNFQQRIVAIRGHLHNEKNNLLVSAKVIQTQLNQQQQVIQTLQVNLQNALSSMTHDRNYQLINQVSYLVRQSNLELTINQNRNQAVALLQNAKKLLNQLSDPLLFSLKKSIDHDVGLLKKTKSLDISKLLVKLDHIDSDVAKISIVPSKYLPVKHKAADSSNDQQLSWYQKLGHFLAEFKTLVVIRHHAQPVHSILSDNQLQILKQNITLKIALAQWAIVNRNQAIYQDSLQQVRDWLQKYIQNKTAISDSLHSVNKLLTINIVPKYPDLSSTLSALNYYLKRSLQFPFKNVMMEDKRVIKALAKKSLKPPGKRSSLSHGSSLEI